MKITKNVLSAIVAMGMLCSFTACTNDEKVESSSNSSTESSSNVGNTQVKDKITAGVDALKAREGKYLIANEMSMPDGNVFYIEVIDNKLGNGYTEYPVDEKGNVGTISFYDEKNKAQYQLFDWWTQSGNAYTFQMTDDKGGVWMQMPDTYGQILLSRNVMYLDILTANAYDFNDGSDLTGEGEDKIVLYTCKVPSEDVAKAMGIDSLSLYESLLTDAMKAEDKSTIELCTKYLDELSMNLVFSEGLLTIQMTNDEITGMTLEAGGLGTRMYITKTIAVSGDDIALRDVPNFTGASAYYDSVKELADYVAQYGSYEEAMIELNKMNSELQQEVEDLEKTEGTLPSESETKTE